MRAIIAAVALVFAIGVVMPIDADARVPSKVEKWGCTFRTVRFISGGESPTMWLSGGVARNCDERQQGTATLSLLQDVPDGPDRVLKRVTYPWSVGPSGVEPFMLVGGYCSPDAPPPTEPFYLWMKVVRKGQPGSASVATANVVNPCPEGTYPVVMAE